MSISGFIAKLKHRPVTSALVAGVLVTSSVFAGVCIDTEYYHPLTNGDGTRYPLNLSSAIWEVLGPIVPVPATDGLTHLAYVIQLSNKSASPMGIDSFDVVNPDNGNQPTGANKVVTIDGTDVTAEVQPFIYKNPLTDSDYSTVLGAGEAGFLPPIVANTNLFLLIGYGLPAALVVLATRGRLGYGATASSVNDERQETIAPALTKLA